MVLDFDGTLKKGFVLAKPIEHTVYDPKVLKELEKAGRLRITRKRNGWKMYLEVNADGEIRFLTDGINEIDKAKVAHLIEEAKQLRLPTRTLLVGEAVADGKNDDRGKVIGIMQAKDKAKIDAAGGVKLHYALFNIVFWNGYKVDDTFKNNYYRLADIVKDAADWGRLEFIDVVELFHPADMPLKKMQKMAVKEKWEGLVLYDAGYKLTYRQDGGSVQRPEGCYKWKPAADADFIVLGCRMREKDPKTIKDLKLYQIDPVNGNYARFYHYGALKNVQREAFSKLPMDLETSKRGKKTVTGWFKEPFVCQLTYDSRREETGALENPREFLVREDKRPEDCVAPQSYPKAEYLKK